MLRDMLEIDYDEMVVASYAMQTGRQQPPGAEAHAKLRSLPHTALAIHFARRMPFYAGHALSQSAQVDDAAAMLE